MEGGRLSGIQPFHPDTIAAPYAFYEAMRAESPVYRVPGASYVCVSRDDLVREVVLDPATYSSNLVAVLLADPRGGARSVSIPGLGAGPEDVLALADPPVHAAQRKLASSALSMRSQRAYDDTIRELVTGCVDAALARGEIDFMHDLAEVVPMRLVLRLVGFDDGDHRRVKAWCDAAVALLGGVQSAEEMAANADAGLHLYGYVVREFRAARARGAPTDLVQALLDGVEGGSDARITEPQATSMLLQLLIAGSDSSASAMGSAMHRLAIDAELQASLRARPERVAGFVEEILRLESPFQGHFRITTRDTELGGVRLPKGTRVMLLWASANRDPQRFAEPERLDPERANARQHLAFGHGPHLCLGAHLARLEIAITVEEMLRRTSNIALGDGPVRHRPSVFTRTLEHLPLRLAPRHPG
jgi:cytochrome P450